MFLEKGVLKICSKLTGEHPCQSVVSLKLLCNFIEITLWHGCSPVNLLHFFRTLFTKNTSGWLLLSINFLLCIFPTYSLWNYHLIEWNNLIYWHSLYTCRDPKENLSSENIQHFQTVTKLQVNFIKPRLIAPKRFK